MITQFWMICRTPSHPGSKSEPRQRFASEAEARQAAQELADQTGAPFTILTATTTVHPKGPQQNLF